MSTKYIKILREIYEEKEQIEEAEKFLSKRKKELEAMLKEIKKIQHDLKTGSGSSVSSFASHRAPL